MTIALALDIAIIMLLGLTLFYAIRLSAYLRFFRQGRDEIQKLFIELTAHIDRAERSMSSMRQAATESGMELQSIVNESNQLCDELKFMNETGDNLAAKLENIADRTRDSLKGLEPSSTPPVQHKAPTHKKSFSIMDKDYTPPDSHSSRDALDDILADSFLEDDLIWDEDAVFEEEGAYTSHKESSDAHAFQSRAEEEFYNSLRKAGLKAGLPETEDAA